MRKYLLSGTILALFILSDSGLTGVLHARPVEKISVTVNLLQQNENKMLISYAPNAPLVISDFKGRPDLSSHGVAATRSGIEMDMSGKWEKDRLDIAVALFVYFDPTQSWMKKAGKNARILNHEQHHFDITAIQYCRLAQEIQSYSFSRYSWDDELRAIYQKHMQELQAYQQRYDRETLHGTNPEAQMKYDREITEALKAQGCFE